MADEEVKATVAATLRTLYGQALVESDLLDLAEEVERSDLGMCCPLCEEVTCDEGCPLEVVRSPGLTDSEKAYFDTIKQVARGPRPEDLVLWAMKLDGERVAAVMQRVPGAGWQALAILLNPGAQVRLTTIDGVTEGKSVDPDDVEGAA